VPGYQQYLEWLLWVAEEFWAVLVLVGAGNVVGSLSSVLLAQSIHALLHLSVPESSPTLSWMLLVIAQQVIEDFAADNCIYLELRTTPKVSLQGSAHLCCCERIQLD
jgi:hypothetical protein